MSAINQAEMALAKPYDQFILFGDSITQMSYNQEIGFGYGAQLQEGKSILSPQHQVLSLADLSQSTPASWMSSTEASRK